MRILTRCVLFAAIASPATAALTFVFCCARINLLQFGLCMTGPNGEFPWGYRCPSTTEECLFGFNGNNWPEYAVRLCSGEDFPDDVSQFHCNGWDNLERVEFVCAGSNSARIEPGLVHDYDDDEDIDLADFALLQNWYGRIE